MDFDTIWLDARLATLAAGRPGLGLIETARSRRATAASRSPARWPICRRGWDAAQKIPLDGRWITPGLIDCHTHLVYAGDRAHEFELRLAGASYEEIARAGGGIVSTVKATRAASEDELVGAKPAAARCADRRRRDHDRDQVRLRARPRERDEAVARRAARSAASATSMW